MYKDYENSNGVSLVTAWQAITDFSTPIPARGKGLITEWYQPSGNLFVGGCSKSIRCWDAEREACFAVSVSMFLFPIFFGFLKTLSTHTTNNSRT